jgi:hypothetical protein
VPVTWLAPIRDAIPLVYDYVALGDKERRNWIVHFMNLAMNFGATHVTWLTIPWDKIVQPIVAETAR